MGKHLILRTTYSLKTKLILSILLLIGFQQFPVIYVGGSFKIYELLGLVVLCLYGISCKRDWLPILMFVFFVVSPIISLISFYICDDVTSYFRTYLYVRNSFRQNIYIFPVLQVIFMAVNYVVLYNIYYCNRLYRRFDFIIRWIIIVGTIIACYSIIAMFTGDPISHLPNLIQNKHVYDFRSSGLSQEPSNYILYQGWIVLFCWFSKRAFGKVMWMVMFTINILSLLLTFSSTLVLFWGLIIFMVFLFSKIYMKIIYIGGLVLALWGGYLVLSKYVDVKMLNYTMVQKLEDFVFGKNDAGGSGGFRHYESSLGWIIFEDNPIIGVGVGNSSYFMHEAAKKSPIIPMDEQLNERSFPPNTISCIFAEQGIAGGGTFVILLLQIVYKLWKYRKNKYGKMFFTGVLFNIGCLLVIAPQYSLYLWTYIFMSLGYIRYAERLDTFKKVIRYKVLNNLIYENCN